MLARFPHGVGAVFDLQILTGNYRTRHSCGGSSGSNPTDQGTVVNNPSLEKLISIHSRVAFMGVSTRGVPRGNSSQEAPDSHSVIVLHPQHPRPQLGPHTH